MLSLDPKYHWAPRIYILAEELQINSCGGRPCTTTLITALEELLALNVAAVIFYYKRSH